MEKENKKRVTPDINEELMMSLMVDGVKKEGIQLPPEPTKAPEKETEIEELNHYGLEVHRFWVAD